MSGEYGLQGVDLYGEVVSQGEGCFTVCRFVIQLEFGALAVIQQDSLQRAAALVIELKLEACHLVTLCCVLVLSSTILFPFLLAVLWF